MTPKERETLEDEWGDAVAVIAGCPGPPPAEAIERLVTLGDAIRAALRETRETPAGLWNTGLTLPPEQDDDIPKTIRAELLECATSNGRISYWYLCHLWRRGRRVGRDQVVAVCFECGPVTAWDEDGCCLSCGDDLPNAHMKPEPVAAPPTGEAGTANHQRNIITAALKRCHRLLEQAVGHVNPEEDPALVDAIQAELMPCDEANICPALAAPVPAAPPDLVELVRRVIAAHTKETVTRAAWADKTEPWSPESGQMFEAVLAREAETREAFSALAAYPLTPKEDTNG